MATYIFGSYHFSFSAPDYCLRIGEQEIKCELQQLQILAFFIEHRDELITKKMLMKPVWGGYATNETVGSAVSRLKKMLKERGDGLEYIQVLPKMGYRLVCSVETEADVDRSHADMKEYPQIEVEVGAVAQIPDSTHNQIILEPGAGWEGFVFAVGNHAEAQYGSESGLVTPTGGLEMSIDRLPEKERAKIFFDLARRASAGMIGSEQDTYLEMIAGDYPRFRAALDHYGKTSASSELEMAVNLAFYWDVRGHWTEGRERLRHALARQGEEISDVKARALAWYGYLSFHLDDYKTAKQVSSDAITMGKQIGDDSISAFALYNLASIAEVEGRFADASAYYNQSLQIGERANDGWIIGRAYRGLGAAALAAGDPVSSKDLYEKGLMKLEETQDLRRIASGYSRLSVVAVALRDTAHARLMLEKSQDTTYGVPGKQSIALADFNRGLIEETAGQYPAALAAFQRSFALRHQLGERRGTAKAMEAVARVSSRMGKEKEGARIMGAAEALREMVSAPMSPVEKSRYGDIMTDMRKKFPEAYQEGMQKVREEFLPVV